MANGISGSFILDGTLGFYAKVRYSETYDTLANKSTLSVQLEVASSQYTGHTYYLDGYLRVNGSAVATFDSVMGTTPVAFWSTDSYKKVPGSPWESGAIAHKSDGSGETTISLDIRGWTPEGPGTPGHGWAISQSKSIALTKIPRASTLGATDAAIGSTSMIAVNRKSAQYTHTIHYTFGKLSGYLTADGTITSTAQKMQSTSIAFQLPSSFYGQIPNAKSGVCTLKCITYQGSKQIGDEQTATFKVLTDAEVCKPTVVGSVVDTNTEATKLTGSNKVLIRYISTAQASIRSTAKNSATIAEQLVNGKEPEQGVVTIPEVDSGKFNFAATDSRGYTTVVTVTPTLIKYIKLTSNVVVERTDPTSGRATLTIKGDWFNGNFGQVINELTITYSINSGTATTVSPSVKAHTYSVEVPIEGLDYQRVSMVSVTVSDACGSVTKTARVNPGIPVFDWGEQDFNFNVPVRLKKSPSNAQDAVNLAYIQGRIQGGEYKASSSAGGQATEHSVRFSKAFSEVPIVVVSLSSDTSAVGYNEITLTVSSVTLTGFTLRVLNASKYSVSPRVSWVALVV